MNWLGITAIIMLVLWVYKLIASADQMRGNEKILKDYEAGKFKK